MVKSSTWWTVRTTLTGSPASRTRVAARAAMQSWTCSRSKPAAAPINASARVSTFLHTRSSSVGAHGGAGTMVWGTSSAR